MSKATLSWGVCLLFLTVGCNRAPLPSTGQPDAAPIVSEPLRERAARGEGVPLFERLSTAQTGVEFSQRLAMDHRLSRLNSSGFVCGGVCIGDFNGDGNVTIADFNIMKANWRSTDNILNKNGELTGPGGVHDGIVDILDFQEFKEHLFPGGASAFASALASAVPEPSTISLAVVLLMGIAIRQRRRV